MSALEAKTKLPALLDRVEEGEEVLITKRGRPVARIVPAVVIDRDRVRATIAAMRREMRRRRLRGLSVRQARDLGRA